uniref:Atx10homo_assoc domain-containing protein n=1 Tax=Caenorhabditis tropicalis TaxID=1561998 RepID=A0A1I7T733_9PELO
MENLLKDLVELGKTKEFNGEIDYGAEISSESFLEAMKVAGMEESSKETLEKFLEDAPQIHRTLLSITFANYLSSTSSDSTSSSESLKKMRRAIRLLLNLIQRSPSFASKIQHECVELLETHLATCAVDVECLLILLKTSETTYLEFHKSPRYSHLLERVLKKIGNSEDITSSIVAYFSTLLEKDYGFLSSCYAETSSESFCEVLDVVRVILEQKNLKIHSNNLLFVLNLIELITVDYGAFLMAKSKKEPNSVEEKRKKTIEMLNLLVELVGEMCINTEMTSHLNEKATAINAIVDVLDTILHAESFFADWRSTLSENWPELPLDPRFEALQKKVEEERRYEETQRKYSDPPKQPPPSRIQRIERSESLSQLAQVIFEQYKNIEDVIGVPLVGELKLNCLKAISNLCSLSSSNKLATLQNGRQGLLSVLQCTSRRPAYFVESYAMRNYSIFCVRQLTDECQENKEVILRLGEPQQPIIDRKRLLKEFGIDEKELSGG